MARDISLSYLYAKPEIWERFEAVTELGWPAKTFLQQACTAYLKVNRTYYAKAAMRDAEYREISEDEYYKTLRDSSEDDLPRYSKGTPGFDVSPLVDIELIPTGPDTRHRYNKVTLSNYNTVLLKVARIVENCPMTQLVSRILEQHLIKYWPTNYSPQFELDRQCRFILED